MKIIKRILTAIRAWRGRRFLLRVRHDMFQLQGRLYNYGYTRSQRRAIVRDLVSTMSNSQLVKAIGDYERND